MMFWSRDWALTGKEQVISGEMICCNAKILERMRSSLWIEGL